MSARAQVQVLVGGIPASVRYAGRSPCCSGLDQIVFDIPANAPAGCTVPLVIRAGSAYSNVGNLSVSADGGACTPPADPGESLACADGSWGFLYVLEVSSTPVPGADVTGTTQSAQGQFARSTGCIRFQNPPVGTCSVSSRVAGEAGAAPEPLQPSQEQPPITITPLDAGPAITLSAPQGQRRLVRAGPVYMSDSAAPVTDPPLFTPGTYRVSGEGGRDVPAFNVPFEFAPIRIASPARGSLVNLNQPPTITWSGGQFARDLLGISLILRDYIGSPIMSFDDLSTQINCTLPGGSAGSFTIPEWIWAQVPSVHGNAASTLKYGYVNVSGGSLRQPFRLPVPSLDYGLNVHMYTSQGYTFQTTR
jgi:hypothetical protein